MALLSDLPQAAGLSSSSALMVGVFLVLAEANHLAARDEYWHNIGSKTDLAGYLGTIENGQSFGTLAGDRGVGTFGGSEDHTAILCAEPEHISQYAYCPVEFEKMLPVPHGLRLCRRQQRYRGPKNRRRPGKVQCGLAAGLGPGRAMEAGDRPRRSAPGGRAGQRAGRRGATSNRCCERPTPTEFDRACAGRAARALHDRKRRDHSRSGRRAGRGRSAGVRPAGRSVADKPPSNCWATRCRRPSSLAAAARRLGAAAASAFGAGFGGSVWALVQADRAEGFLAAWADAYRADYPQHAPLASFFLTAAGPAAFRVC